MNALAHVPDPIAAEVRAVIGEHSKSFALASRLLPADARLDAQILYAYCRRADDAVDEAPADAQAARLDGLYAELDLVYAERTPGDRLLGALQRVVRARNIPRAYLDELIAGMAMDVQQQRYDSDEQLLRYCYRVAGTVGLMMCHVMGVRSGEALEHAAHLGIGMQLTNIARDVFEDWGRGRLYLPDDLLRRHGVGGLRERLGQAFPADAAPGLSRAIAELLTRADGYYASGDAGLAYLALRSGFGVRAARHIYADIGRELRARGCDPLGGRAVVGLARKLWLVARAALGTLRQLPSSLALPRPTTPHRHLADPREVLMLPGA